MGRAQKQMMRIVFELGSRCKYCEASGQKVNLGKSSLFFSKLCKQRIRDNIKSITQVENESLNENIWAYLQKLEGKQMELSSTSKIKCGIKFRDG